jgi:hypothetical protein
MGALRYFGILVVLTIVAAVLVVKYAPNTVRAPLVALAILPTGALRVTLPPFTQLPFDSGYLSSWQGKPMAIETKSLGTINATVYSLEIPSDLTTPVFIMSSPGVHSGAGMYTYDPSDGVTIDLGA